jgi:hypothetical protein
MVTYEQAKRLKELGFPQKHHKYSKYYLTEDYIVDFETAHSIYDPKKIKEETQFAGGWPNWDNIEYTNVLIYIPTLEDMIGMQSYDLTLDAAVFQWIDANKTSINPQDLIKRNEDAYKKDIKEA